MADQQHDDHCTIFAGDYVWRIVAVQFPVLALSCPCGCTSAEFRFEPGFDFDGYCDHAVMMLTAESLRQERGSLPVAAGSGARN